MINQTRQVPEFFHFFQQQEKVEVYKTDNPQELAQQLLREQISKVISEEKINKLFNLVSFSILAGVLIFGGAQLASVGIKMIFNSLRSK